MLDIRRVFGDLFFTFLSDFAWNFGHSPKKPQSFQAFVVQASGRLGLSQNASDGWPRPKTGTSLMLCPIW